MTSGFAAPDDAATIQRRSQEFSDASASGDAKVLAKLLDDVVFVDESGAIGTGDDIVSSAKVPVEGSAITSNNRTLSSNCTAMSR